MAAPTPTTAAAAHHRTLLPSPRGALAPASLRLPLRAHQQQPHPHALALALAQRARLPAAPVAAAASTASPDAPASGAVPGKPTVLVAEKLGAAGLALLREFANVDCSYGLSPEDLRAKISLCDALIVRSGTKVGRDVFEASGGRLRVVGRAGVGIDNVDLAAATEHGCLVVNAPTANTVAAAEHGIALLTAMARNIAQADAALKAGQCFFGATSSSFVEK
jgi:D-3-phosphoglycerate dehydrogenase